MQRCSVVSSLFFLQGSLPFTSADDSGSESPEHLWELVRFVRREKDIAETKKEMAEDENVRLTQSNKHLERKLQETEVQLQELSEIVKVRLGRVVGRDVLLEKGG